MEAQQTRIDNIANNIANVATTGFKKWRAEFQDLFYEVLRAPGVQASDGTQVPTGVQVGHGVRLAAVSRITTPGDRVRTAHDLDLAIDGEGYFQLQRADGQTVYTRDGTFKRSSTGEIVSIHGYSLIPGITIPDEAIQITILEDGTVTALTPTDPTPAQLGQIQTARFTNPAGLRAMGNNVFLPTEASGTPQTGTPDADGFGAIAQGFLESSNVNIAEELVGMILAQRAFEVNARVIQAGDEMLQAAAAITRG
jgi:flagellar basal-body rod protein FlgG